MKLAICLVLACGIAVSGIAAEPAVAVNRQGIAVRRVDEKIDRGLVAIRQKPNQVYVGWRLLQSDPKGVAFNVYRRDGKSSPIKINSQPVLRTTDYTDRAAPATKDLCYLVRSVIGGREVKTPSDSPVRVAENSQYIRVPLHGPYTVQKIGIADLDGDGRYDFVVKQPSDNIDPFRAYWQRSPGTYKLEAYRHDGKFLWRYDLGWAIERGIWYSPYVVYDLDGDGKAEVAVKTGEGDPRDDDGRVTSGPEYLTVLDGTTGRPVARTDWPSREPFMGKDRLVSYNRASRNQLGVAWLDGVGKPPCLIAARGTYGYMTAVAYEYRNHKLHERWRWDNKNLPRSYQGQGAHWMQCADVNADGHDEVILGSCVLDHRGHELWTTGLGHCDSAYLGDLDPSRPGLEIYYNMETRNRRNGMCMVDAATGRILWGHSEPTIHIHGSGMCSDIDPTRPGSECYGGERDSKDKRWLRDCKGNVLSTEDMSLQLRPVYWDADPQRELLRGHTLFKYKGPKLAKIEGNLLAVVDLCGDWREEIVTSVRGEVRIYTTTIPAVDPHVCLMQDPLYRSDVIMAAMGYYQCPLTSYDMATSGSR
jgi:rhamnogalacturonan endolyase